MGKGFAAAAGACLLLAGCTSGGAAHAAPTGGRTVNLTDYADNDGPRSTVILTGAIGDFGQATSVHPDGTVDPDHTSRLALALRAGSFQLGIADLEKRFVKAMSHFPPDTTTCSGTVTVSAAAPIVAGSGTGAYAGIRGEFHLTLTLAEVDAKARCGASSAFLKQSIVTAGAGTVAFA